MRKHECQEDIFEVALKNDDDSKLKVKKIRCNCCKQFGHTIDNCPRDPNIKTKMNPQHENSRILKLTDFRKSFADTAITTTFFLKKCS